MKGINRALDLDHSISSPTTINLAYKTFHYLPLEARNKIVVSFFSDKYFYSLFFSWSYTIRDIFFAFMLYQVEHTFLFKIACMSNNDDHSKILNVSNDEDP